MRRFLQAWGRQEPLLCPAEASSPPPLSAFHSSPCYTSILPTSETTTNLFVNIERQISAAKLSPESKLFCAQLSPAQAHQQPNGHDFAGLTAAAELQQRQRANSFANVVVTSSAPNPPSSADANDLLALAEQQQQQNGTVNNAIPQQAGAPAHQQKGLDAFFAALTSANSVENDRSVQQQQQQQIQSSQNGTTAPMLSQSFGLIGQQQSPGNAQVMLAGLNDGIMGQQTTTAASTAAAESTATLMPQQLSQSIQAAANNAIATAANNAIATAANNALANAVIANAMNAAAANVIANAVQQQHQQQQQQAVAVAAQQQHQQNQSQSSATTTSLLANLSPSSLQSQAASDRQFAAVAAAAASNSAALNSAIQLAQSAIHQQKQHQQQQQQQFQQQFCGPLSPEGIVQAGLPALLNRLAPPNILRPPGPSQSKPIPLLESKVDLLQFRAKEPREWNSDDVIAWILDIARRHQIPCENINLAKFATCTGPRLMLMNEQSFSEHDPSYGSLLFGEFCKLVTDETFIDEWMRSANAPPPPPPNGMSAPGPSMQQQQQHQQQQQIASQNAATMGSCLLAANLALQKLAAGPSAAAAESASSSSICGQQQQQQPQNLLFAAAAAAVQQQQQHQQLGLPTLGQLLPAPSAAGGSHLLGGLHQQPQPMLASMPKSLQAQQSMAGLINRAGTSAGGSGMRPAVRTGSSKLAEQKIRRNKDGRPRKRSQHTKGNKLWEFIRDALKDPRTCPSIVRWEDPSEGVFRIIESERLAYLWGQKKNNQKMTYEKLSRAMRTYYEKEILVPVPKSGLYPKKLVYKFGPCAMGWKLAASLAVQSHLAAASHHHHI